MLGVCIVNNLKYNSNKPDFLWELSFIPTPENLCHHLRYLPITVRQNMRLMFLLLLLPLRRVQRTLCSPQAREEERAL